MKWQGGLNFVNDTADFYRSPECSSLSLLLCLLPKVVGSSSFTSASSLCALGAAGLQQQLPAWPVELWTCSSPLRQTHPKALSHHAPRMGTADSGILLHNLVCGRDFSFKISLSEHVLFWHDLMSIVEYRIEKVKIIHRVQQERKAFCLGSKTISRAKHSNKPFTF